MSVSPNMSIVLERYKTFQHYFFMSLCVGNYDGYEYAFFWISMPFLLLLSFNDRLDHALQDFSHLRLIAMIQLPDFGHGVVPRLIPGLAPKQQVMRVFSGMIF